VPTPIPQLDNHLLWFDESLSHANDNVEAPHAAHANSAQEESNLCVQLMSVSAGMVGVCLTVIGIFKLFHNLRGAGTIADDLVAIDSLLFVTVCIISYGGMRTANRKWRLRLERTADVCFLSALTFMAVICGIIAWAIA
jgi:hypothetical protein